MAQITLNSTGVASSGALALQSNGTTTAVTIDTNQNVGIGTSSPQASAKLHVFATGDYTDEGAPFTLGSSSTNGMRLYAGVNNTSDYAYIGSVESGAAYRNLVLQPNGGNLLVGTTSQINAGVLCVKQVGSNDCINTAPITASTYVSARFCGSGGGTIGYISTSTTATSYVTGSDYRLKEAITPMTGALAKVAELKPVTYKWKLDGSDSQGFIAHELAEIVPECVVGEKDAVDAEGNPVYQGIDTSFLVATLTAAIQELKALVDTQASTITTLTDRITALEAK